MKKVFKIIGKITFLTIAYIIGYVVFLKLNQLNIENCWKYCIVYIYGGVVGQIYLLSSIKFNGKE